ncbi:unnamed protein product [Prorocentrum cordatum]|uniref:B9 domain-containing protein 1 n=1 Tax=Prorocentrum cordatum TaxID=2364126 RepID=A0ABN9YCW8_9DINO|nr:unnamed protein product [Polarella glacialis]
MQYGGAGQGEFNRQQAATQSLLGSTAPGAGHAAASSAGQHFAGQSPQYQQQQAATQGLLSAGSPHPQHAEALRSPSPAARAPSPAPPGAGSLGSLAAAQDARTQQLLGGGAGAGGQQPGEWARQDAVTQAILASRASSPAADRAARPRALRDEERRGSLREAKAINPLGDTVTCFRMVLNGEIESAQMGASGPLMCVFSVQHGADWTIVSGAPNGVTQLACSTSPLVASIAASLRGGRLREVVWNFPIGLVLKSTSPFGWPRIAVVVYGTDMCNRRVVKGYGSVHVPCQPGRHVRTVRLYCPLSSSPLTRLFGALFANPAQLVDPRIITGVESREVIRVQSGGQVRVTFEVMLKDTETFNYSF